MPRADLAAAGLAPTELQTSCPYKGIASYYDIDAGKMGSPGIDVDMVRAGLFA